MKDPQLGRAIWYYKERLDALEVTRSNLRRSKLQSLDLAILEEQILEVLVARDRVQLLLDKEVNSATITDTLRTISKQDERLEKLEPFIARKGKLDQWLKIRKVSPDAWWWQPNHPLDRFDWAFNGLSIAFLTIALGFATNITLRFLTGGPDVVGTTTIAIQSVLGFIGARVALTPVTETGALGQIFKLLRIPKVIYQELRSLLSFFLLLGVVILFFLLPKFSEYYSQQGYVAYEAKKLANAQNNLSRAISLNPENAMAHYFLGRLYEDMQLLDQARTEYQIAARAGVSEAYNHLGRRYILEGKYSIAVNFLQEGLVLVTEQRKAFTVPIDIKVDYAFYKNLGWARLGQKRYQEAEAKLLQAIELNENLSDQEKRVDANCLLAKVYQAKNKQKANKLSAKDLQRIEKNWDVCLTGSGSNQELDDWIGEAKKFFKTKR